MSIANITAHVLTCRLSKITELFCLECSSMWDANGVKLEDRLLLLYIEKMPDIIGLKFIDKDKFC